MFEDRLKEFYELDNERKFNKQSYITFSDGVKTAEWFFQNKKKIMVSDELICKKILEDYEKVKVKYRLEFEKRVSSSYIVTDLFYKRCEEFLKEKDFIKFEADCKICFSDGINMYSWYAENSVRISTSTNPLCINIKKQREEYELRKKSKKIFEENKKKYIFYKISSYSKFKKNSSLTFFDKSLVSKWFYNELRKDKSNDRIWSEILIQYDEFLDFESLEQIFSDLDEEKFEEYSNVRFPTGALANDWWESNKKLILEENDLIDINIKKQYAKYLDKKDILIK